MSNQVRAMLKNMSYSEIAGCSSYVANKQSLSYLSVLEIGDCIVAFSRNDIFAIKREIENNTSHRCCVIYGSLPPSTRTQQAKRFNDPNSGYDVLVASDAIGMGLNLNIKRIIFNSIFKSDGSAIVRLDHSAIKQISGRAGRRNSPFPDGGTYYLKLDDDQRSNIIW
jgi:ATP-dependent RNA helicase SUPV3L1/SUV3